MSNEMEPSTKQPTTSDATGPTVVLANGLTAQVSLTPSQPKSVVITVTGFRSFVDVLRAEDARNLVALISTALETSPTDTKKTIGSFDCPVRAPATETRTVIANHHRSRIRMTRLRFTPPSHFATFVYDLDQTQGALLRDALTKAVEQCR